MPANILLAAALAAILLAGCAATPVTRSTDGPAGSPPPAQTATVDPTATPFASHTLDRTNTPTPGRSKAPTPEPTTAAAPPPPSAVKMTIKGSDPTNQGFDTHLKVTISWKYANPDGVRIRVYGVTACLPPAGRDPAPCLVKGTPLPPRVRELIATAEAARGKVSWTWPSWDDVGGAVMADANHVYESIVVAAYSDTGHSKFIIVATGEYCSTCTY